MRKRDSTQDHPQHTLSSKVVGKGHGVSSFSDGRLHEVSVEEQEQDGG